MADEIKLTDLTNLANGKIIERFADELKKVMENIEDERTDAGARREIGIILKFAPADSRLAVEVSATFKTKLAAPKDLVSTVFVGHDRMGAPIALNSNPNQPELFKN